MEIESFYKCEHNMRYNDKTVKQQSESKERKKKEILAI